MSSIELNATNVTRRHFFQECGIGVGKIALAGLLSDKLNSPSFATSDSGNPLAPRPPHFAPKAKRVIHLFMAGIRANWISSTASPS